MAIVETKLFVRPNTTVNFYTLNGLSLTRPAGADRVRTTLEALRDAGKFTTEVTFSDDKLTQTQIVTYDSIDTWSQRDTALDIAFDYDYYTYAQANGITAPSAPLRQYTLSGIDQPFTCTTVYTFPTGNSDFIGTLSTGFSTRLVSATKLTSATATDTTLTLVHQYNNADDFTVNCFVDFPGVGELHSRGATRTITYALV